MAKKFIRDIPVDEDFMDQLYDELLVAWFRKKLYNYSKNLSVSLPLDLIIAFRQTCRFNGEHYKDVIERLIRNYLKENGHEVCVPRMEDKIVELIDKHDRYIEMIRSETSVVYRTAMTYLDEIFEVNEIEVRKHRDRKGLQFVDRVDLVTYKEVLKVFDDLYKMINPDSKSISEGEEYLTHEDLYPYILERANRIPNPEVKKSFLEHLAVHKTRIDKDPESVKRQAKKAEYDRIVKEYLSRVKQPEHVKDEGDIAAEMAKLMKPEIPNFGNSVEVQQNDRK